MATPYDVPGDILVERLAKYLFENYRDIVKPPHWANFIKTRPGNERNPDFPAEEGYNGEPGWWYYRAASVLRQVYLKGPIGLSRLRRKYGGIVKRGMEPGRFRKGYGKILRLILQQLEKAELVKKELEGKKKGRVITEKGRSLLDKISTEIKKELKKEVPNLIDYVKTFV